LSHGLTLDACNIKITSIAGKILLGETITTSWHMDSDFGTMARRRVLGLRFVSQCFCRRCHDPSENGSEFGSFICDQCNKIPPLGEDLEKEVLYNFMEGPKPECPNYAVIRSADPVSPRGVWRCSNPSCSNALSPQEVSDTLKLIYDHIEKNKENIQGLEKLIRTYGHRVVHKDHYMMIRAKHYIIKMIVHQVRTGGFAQVNPGLLKKGIEHVQDCLEVYEKITPGDCLMRGKMLYLSFPIPIYFIRIHILISTYCISSSMAALKNFIFLFIYIP
jgi:hypothetical protein